MLPKTRVGIIGTGFIARGLHALLHAAEDFQPSCILTRRDIDTVRDLPDHLLTPAVEALVERSDIIIECSGDAIHATEVLWEARTARKPIGTIDSEFQVTTGSWFARQGIYITEADGDQPGCLARLKREAEMMGFTPLCYVNLKGFLNPNPTPTEMQYWAEKQQLQLNQVVSFTDGTKLQIEQALVANGLGAGIARPGMIGAEVADLGDLDFLVEAAQTKGSPLSDYVLIPGGPPGVLILATNAIADTLEGYLPFSRLRTKQGLAYRLLRPHHLCHLEIVKTLRDVVAGEAELLNNSANPTVTVAAIAKRSIRQGETIACSVGGFDVRGMAVPIDEYPDAVPICLLANSRALHEVPEGQIVRFEDVEVLPTKALELYRALMQDIVKDKVPT